MSNMSDWRAREKMATAIRGAQGIANVPTIYESRQMADAAFKALEEAGVLRVDDSEAMSRLAEVREFVDYPGNWSAYDGRRSLILRLLDGETVEWKR